MKPKKKFILIDDDSIQNMLCKMVIKKTFGDDTDVVSFTEPEEGIDYIKHEYTKNLSHASLLLDINMPTLTGWEVLTELKELPEEIKKNLGIYIHSSSIDTADRQQAENHPMVSGFIEKPISASALMSL
jgi:CheY-like chemotaxis protein